MAFGDALTEAMRERGTNANRVAKASGVSRFYISKLVNGEIKDPTWAKACAIIDALEMKPSEFREFQEQVEYAAIELPKGDDAL